MQSSKQINWIGWNNFNSAIIFAIDVPVNSKTTHPPRAIPGRLTRVKLRRVGNEAHKVGHLTFLSKRLSAVGNKRISQFFASASEPRSRAIALVNFTWVFSVVHVVVLYSYVPVKSKLKHPPPPGIPRAFDVFSCARGREFDELSLPEGGAFDHYPYGVGNLIASLDFILRVPLIPNHGGDKPWCIHSKRNLIRGELAEKKRLAQALLCIWRYSRTIYIIFGM